MGEMQGVAEVDGSLVAPVGNDTMRGTAPSMRPSEVVVPGHLV